MWAAKSKRQVCTSALMYVSVRTFSITSHSFRSEQIQQKRPDPPCVHPQKYLLLRLGLKAYINAIFHTSKDTFRTNYIDLVCRTAYAVTKVRHQSYLFAVNPRIALLLRGSKSQTFSPSRWIRFSFHVLQEFTIQQGVLKFYYNGSTKDVRNANGIDINALTE